MSKLRPKTSQAGAGQSRGMKAPSVDVWEIIEIADDKTGDYITTGDGKRIVDHEHIQSSRLRVDARKWVAARLAPKKVKEPGPNFQPAICVTVEAAVCRTSCARAA